MSNSTVDANDIKKQLAAMRERWNTAKTSETAKNAGGYTRLPNGRYLFRLEVMEIVPSQASGKLQLHLHLKVMEGEKTGDNHHVYNGLEATPKFDPMPYTAAMLNQFGADAEQLDITQLPEICAAITAIHPLVKARLYQKKDRESGELSEYQNTIIEEVYDPNVGPDTGVKSTSDDEEDVAEEEGDAATANEFKIQDKVEFKAQDGTEKIGIIQSFVDPETVKIASGGKIYTRKTNVISKYTE